MRTNIEIDDRLLAKARKLTRLRTKREIVHRALETLVEKARQSHWEKFLELRSQTEVPPEFMKDRQDEFPQERDLF